jgi:5-deoxy-glucuronate isomerase
VIYRGERVQLDLPFLEAGGRARIAPPAGEEGVLVLLAGDLEWDGVRATRNDVFDARASAVYLPEGCSVDVVAHAPTELALAATRNAGLSAAESAPSFIAPADVVVHERGAPGWQRQVHDIAADNVRAQALIVGETFNEPGQWSSFPPHKHDGEDGEPALEEVYYYRFDRPDGFGFQGLYESGDGEGGTRREHAVFLRHGAIVGIPRGYHPVCAAPGYRLYYLWALVGNPRQLAMHEDPAHRWLHDPEAGAG